MPAKRVFTTLRLVNGSTGDPLLYIDYPGRDDAILFDAGDNAALSMQELRDLGWLFLSHHHIDHFVGFDRIFRANLDTDKVLHVFGPQGTIDRVHQRIRSYEIPRFDFQKLVLRVTDVEAGRLSSADMSVAAGFPTPVVESRVWKGPVLYENATLKVECAFADHTVPCLAFALVEKKGHHADAAKLAKGGVKPGPWIEAALTKLRDGAAMDEQISIGGGVFSLEQLTRDYFTYSTGARVAYVTDTQWSDAAKPGLIKLARNAQQLFCDSFYLGSQLKQALKHRHMTASHAAELATAAGVEQLHLIHFSARYNGQYDLLLSEARAGFANVTATIDSSSK